MLGGSSESRSVDENGKETVETIGLTAGTKYVISATPFNKLLDGDGNLTGIVYGKETFGEVLTLNEPQKAKITLAADQKVYQVGRSENEKDEDGNVTEKIVMYDTYAASSVNFTAKADMAVSGTWVLDGEEVKTGTFEHTSEIAIPLKDLADGDHTLQIYGKNEKGDGFDQSFVFNIDTTAPTLMLTSPTNGSGFAEDGTLTISGITEPDAKLTITVDGKPLAREKTLGDLGTALGEGNEFAYEVNIGSGYYKKEVEITVSDAVGNKETARNSVYNDGMGNIKNLDIALSADTTETTQKQWISYTNKNLFLKDADGVEVALRLCAVTENDQKIILNDLDTVDLEVHAVSGTAAIEGNKLTVSKDGHGFGAGQMEPGRRCGNDGLLHLRSRSLRADRRGKRSSGDLPCKRRKRCDDRSEQSV